MPSNNRRDREIARRRYERRQAKREEARTRARRRNTILSASAGVLVLIGVASYLGVALSGGSSPHKAAAATTSATPSAPASAAPVSDNCTYTASTGGKVARNVGRPPNGRASTAPATMTIVTNHGTIKVDLLPAKAPCTVNSFRYLAGKGYFNNSPCHRLTTAGIYVLQCGDPSGTGSGTPGYSFHDENLTGAKYPAGTVAMANAGPNTNGSQFFLVYKDSQLSPNYTPFGRVTSGLSVITQIASKGTDNSNGPGDGHPKDATRIVSLTVHQG